LHQRYLDKLGKQEDEVEKYRADIKKLQGQVGPPVAAGAGHQVDPAGQLDEVVVGAQGEGAGLDGRPPLAGEDEHRRVAGGGVGAAELDHRATLTMYVGPLPLYYTVAFGRSTSLVDSQVRS
jgi:hypothetical protein